MIAVLEDASSTYSEWAPEGWNPAQTLADSERKLIPERIGLPGWWSQVAEHDGQMVGYVILRPATEGYAADRPIAGLAHVWHLFVRRAWWGSGVASGLLSAGLAGAAERGYDSARLWTPRLNARARAFYRREGWRETGEETYAPRLDLDLVEYRRSCA
ncbi:MAG TPA: GNAT family N-acetyltransferase [Thermoleophilaceae bacterium]|nr:GNAT family N-acetyltransferase [Thermoleophilaceae bacterium]